MAKKLGFALGAGGSRGVAHIGFIKAMEEANIKADFVAGTSMGSVVGACYSAGYSADFMKSEIDALTMSDIFDLSFNPIGAGALLKANKMRKKISSYVEEKPTFDKLDIPFSCVAVDLNQGKLKIFSGKEDVAEGVVASSTIPGIFKPYAKDDMLLVDGGVMCRVPVQQVRDMGAEVVVAVDVLGDVRPQTKRYNLVTLLLRTFDVMDAELTKHKFAEEIPDLSLCPDLGDMIQYKFKDMQMAYDKGYEIGKKNVRKIKKLIAD